MPIAINYVGLPNLPNNSADKPAFINNSERKFFFTIGQVADKKNFHVLVDMMELMPEYDLYICGQASSNPDYTQLIEQKIKEKNLTNVFLTDAIDPSVKVWMYQHCYAFVFPSKFEGFGIPVVDAMSFGKPVFSSQLTSLKEIGDKYAYFWDSFEPEHMKSVIENNIERFYDDEELIERAREYANSFTIERHLQSYLSLYRNMKPKKKSIWRTLRNYYTFLRY